MLSSHTKMRTFSGFLSSREPPRDRNAAAPCVPPAAFVGLSCPPASPLSRFLFLDGMRICCRMSFILTRVIGLKSLKHGSPRHRSFHVSRRGDSRTLAPAAAAEAIDTSDGTVIICVGSELHGRPESLVTACPVVGIGFVPGCLCSCRRRTGSRPRTPLLSFARAAAFAQGMTTRAQSIQAREISPPLEWWSKMTSSYREALPSSASSCDT